MLVKNTLIALLVATPAFAVPVATTEKKAITGHKAGTVHEVTKGTVSTADELVPHNKAEVPAHGRLERRYSEKEEKEAAKRQKAAIKIMNKEVKKMPRGQAREEEAAQKMAKQKAKLGNAVNRNKRSLRINTNGLNKRADLASAGLPPTPLSAPASLHEAQRSRKSGKAHKHTVSEKLQLNAMLLEAEHLVNALEGQMNKEPTAFPNLKHANKMRKIHKINPASPKTPLTPATPATPTKAT